MTTSRPAPVRERVSAASRTQQRMRASAHGLRSAASPAAAAPEPPAAATTTDSIVDRLQNVVVTSWQRWTVLLVLGAVLGGLDVSSEAGLVIIAVACVDVLLSSVYLAVRSLWRSSVQSRQRRRE